MFPLMIKPAGFGKGVGGGNYSPTIALTQGRAGMTTIVDVVQDDASISIGDTGFDVPIYGSLYRSNIFVGSNGYITFGFGSSAYSGLSRTNPGRGLLVSAADHNWVFVAVKADPGKFRVRWEGQAFRSSDLTSVFIWEATFFPDGVIQLALDRIPITSGVSTLTKGDNVTFNDYAPNTGNNPNSFVFLPNDAAGNSHTVQTGSYG